ncbi:MAG: hypothetical protein WD426_00045 [Anditalea sp.]
MKKLLTVCLILFTATVQAQDLFQESLFSADLVMKSREKIDLSDLESERIKKIHSENAAEFNILKWDLESATSKLKAMLEESKPNLDAVQKQMDVVLNLENSLKKRKLFTLVAIKNELTEKQQDELQKVKGQLSSKPVAVRSSKKRSGSLAMTLKSDNTKDKPIIYITTQEGLTEIKDLEKIKPDNIKSVEVLKDQSAIDRVGKEGKNGVVIITLKDGDK